METKAPLACPGCGKLYPWRPEYQGRRIKCPCGAMVTAGERAVTVASGYVVGHRARPQVADDTGGASPLRDWAAPLTLLAIGLTGRAVELGTLHGGGAAAHKPGVAIGFAAGAILLSAVALTVGALAAAQVMGSELDTPGALARKVAGLAAFAAFAGVLCASFDKEPGQIRGVVVALHAVVLIYFVGITYLLKMDLLEALMATIVALAIQVGLFLAIAQSVPSGVGRLMFYGS